MSWLGWPIITRHDASSISIGPNSVFCSRSTQTVLAVNHAVTIRTLRAHASIIIGHGSKMSGTTICAATQIRIGSRCMIGANVIIADTDFHSLDPTIRASADDARRAATKPITIGDDVFIGGGSYILKGVKIGNRAIVGAGSVVTHDIPDDAIAAGNPAVVISQRTRIPRAS